MKFLVDPTYLNNNIWWTNLRLEIRYTKQKLISIFNSNITYSYINSFLLKRSYLIYFTKQKFHFPLNKLFSRRNLFPRIFIKTFHGEVSWLTLQRCTKLPPYRHTAIASASWRLSCNFIVWCFDAYDDHSNTTTSVVFSFEIVVENLVRLKFLFL